MQWCQAVKERLFFAYMPQLFSLLVGRGRFASYQNLGLQAACL